MPAFWVQPKRSPLGPSRSISGVSGRLPAGPAPTVWTSRRPGAAAGRRRSRRNRSPPACLPVRSCQLLRRSGAPRLRARVRSAAPPVYTSAPRAGAPSARLPATRPRGAPAPPARGEARRCPRAGRGSRGGPPCRSPRLAGGDAPGSRGSPGTPRDKSRSIRSSGVRPVSGTARNRTRHAALRRWRSRIAASERSSRRSSNSVSPRPLAMTGAASCSSDRNARQSALNVVMRRPPRPGGLTGGGAGADHAGVSCSRPGWRASARCAGGARRRGGDRRAGCPSAGRSRPA